MEGNLPESGAVGQQSSTETKLKRNYDIAIVGGGVAGVLAYNRLKSLLPEAQIVLLEAENVPGGRRRISDFSESPSYRSYGLSLLSRQLLSFCYELHKQAHLEDSVAEELFNSFHQPEVVCLTGGKLISKKTTDEILSVDIIKKLGGGSAGDQLKTYLEKVASDSVSDPDGHVHPLSRSWPGNRKDVALQIIDKILYYFGGADSWNIHEGTLNYLISSGISDQRLGDVNTLCRILLKDYDKDLENCFFGARVFNAVLNADKMWEISAGGQVTTCQALVCCQSPWEALRWLNKDHVPADVLQLAAKVQPTSLVSLSTVLDESSGENPLPDVCFVISEDAQAIKTSHNELVFRTAIPFEHSLQSPSVLKAIKSLKRAQKKYATQFDVPLDLRAEHVALLTSAWTVSLAASDRKYFERMEKQKFQSEKLLFIGDAYGECLNGDDNIIKSLLAASGILSQRSGK